MKPLRSHLFPTPIGTMGLVHDGSRLGGILLPAKEELDLLEGLAARGASPPEALPKALAFVPATICDYLEGRIEDLDALPLDLCGMTDFARTVSETLRGTRPGEVLSYGELAAMVGSPGAARAVGTVMRKNPFALAIPCHRVVASGGKPGGYNAAGGVELKARLLAREGRALFAKGYGPACRVLAKDPGLAALMAEVGPVTLEPRFDQDPYPSLGRAILFQQLSTKAAQTIYQRVVDLTPGAEFPSPEAMLGLTEETLRQAGVSRPKIRALKDLAERAHQGELPQGARLQVLPDTELIRILTQVRGVGRWTVEMLLIFGLGRLDVFPADDLGVRKGFQILRGLEELPSPKELTREGVAFGPYRSLAAWYLWRATELAPGSFRPPSLSRAG